MTKGKVNWIRVPEGRIEFPHDDYFLSVFTQDNKNQTAAEWLTM